MKRDLATGVPIIYRLNADSTVASKLDLARVTPADIAVLDAQRQWPPSTNWPACWRIVLRAAHRSNFMLPYSRDDAAGFFKKAIASVARGETVLLAARLDGRIVGTGATRHRYPPNQPHRGEIRKLLVHRAARNKGIGAALMARAEAIAKEREANASRARHRKRRGGTLYTRGGWQRLGSIPDYAMWPGGRFCDTTIFWKKLSAYAAAIPASQPSIARLRVMPQ